MPPRGRASQWIGPDHNDRDSSPDGDGSGLGRALRGLLNGATKPNRPDPTNPVVNGVASEKRSFWRNLVAETLTQLPRGADDFELASSLLKSKIFDGGIVDDRTLQQEKVLSLIASLPEEGEPQRKAANFFVKVLWDDLQHPPLSNLGEDYRYRQANGCNNNIMYPHLGKAGSSYARTVTPKTLLPGILPDPGLIFDTIFARGEETREHPNKLSSVLVYWAIIIIHDLFRTDERDCSKLRTSSYLDLAPLYGNSDEELARIRTFQNGLLKPDTFCESRVLGFPPGVAALLVCFNRYHNYIAVTLKEINEKGRFTPPADPENKAGLQRLDNDLFQTARLITCGLYVNIILTDYVRTILNLNRMNTSWTLDPREALDGVYNSDGVPVGIGNQVSVEFNLVYRWHAMTSLKDEQWTNDIYQKLFREKDISKLTEEEFASGLHQWIRSLGDDPTKWTLDFGRFQRTERGTFKDGDLVEILAEATEDVACAFGARQVPVAMKLIETMGIKQARAWNVATLNEFRKFFKLKPYEKFSEISSDPEVAHALKALYKHPDYVEMYPGLIAEDAKPAGPSSGLCPGYTISRTVLSDAVALVRGDRFYTVDNTPANLTNWGYNFIQPDPDVASGQCIYNLLMHALPGWYRGNSVYAMFPFVIPFENRNILRELKQDHRYTFARPALKPTPTVVKTWQTTAKILEDQDRFEVPWGPHTEALIGDKYPYMLSYDGPLATKQRKEVDSVLYCPVNGLKQVREFYEALTTQLITIRSERLRGDWFQLDACRDVANPSHAIFVARMWNIPLKGPGDMSTGVEINQLYLALVVSFAYVFLDADAASSFKLMNGAEESSDQLKLLLTYVVEKVKIGKDPIIGTLLEMGKAGQMLSEFGKNLIKSLLDQGKSVEEIVAIIVPTAAAAVATQAQHVTGLLDVYLSDRYKKHWPEIQRLAQSEKEEDFEKLKMYALEANRLKPASKGLLRNVACDTTITDGDKNIAIHKDDQIFVDFYAAGRDPARFPNPEEIDITRNKDDYIHHGRGPHSCLGRAMVEIAMATQLRVFAKLKNLRRAPGPQGHMKTVKLAQNPFSSDPSDFSFAVFLKEDWSAYWPYPTTLKVHHDGFIGSLQDLEELLFQETGLPHRSTNLRESRMMNGDVTAKQSNEQPNGITSRRPNKDVNGRTEEIASAK